MEAWRKLACRSRMGSDVRGYRWCSRAAGSARCSHRAASAYREANARESVKHSPEFLKLVDDAKSRIREVSVDETRRKLDARKAAVIDVREESEWNAGHIRGAEHLGKGIIERDIEALVPDKNSEIILYCGGGFRSALSADNLQKMGYANVYSMAGGWRAWQESGAPVESGAGK
jgi:rhodanese-related sulfurtransferase